MPENKKKKGEEVHEEMILDEEATKELEEKEQVDTPEEVEEEVKEHEKEEKPREVILEEELADYKEKYLRLYSEFENFRRRTNKERFDTIAQANEKLLIDILPVMDDFERAEKVLDESKDLEAHSKGIELIQKKFKTILESKGIKKMEVIGKDFEPDLHEAITQIPVENKKQKGKVVDVIEEGYFLNDKVLRFAKVVVGQA